ncbi:MAG: FxsA family protein [Methylobacterium sp.]|jgi:UPF0716 protein FxsA|nr:FxsA family protein [Methylobacterium sp.]
MRLLMLLVILLAFPGLELALLVKLGQRYGWWLAAYLLFTVLAGWLLIQDERIAALGRMAQTVRQGGHPLRALLTSAKKLLAGILFIVPGVITDVLAVLLLLLPARWIAPQRPAANDDVIEGEWRRDAQDLLK